MSTVEDSDVSIASILLAIVVGAALAVWLRLTAWIKGDA